MPGPQTQTQTSALALARAARAMAAQAGAPALRASAIAILIDTVGRTLAGSRGGLPEKALRALAPAPGPASILGGAGGIAALDAAFVNAAAAGDASCPAAGPVLAALLALGEARQETGARLTDAFLAGLLLAARLREAGASCPARVAALSAAAACALMMELDDTGVASALALAASLQPETAPPGGAALHLASAARNGLFAALLAQEGMEGAGDAALPAVAVDLAATPEDLPRISSGELFDRFEERAGSVLAADIVAILFERLETIDALPDLARLGRLLRVAAGPAVAPDGGFSRIDLAMDETAVETQWVP